MRNGAFDQIADAASLYQRPATLFVLEFIGQSIRMPGRVVGNRHGICDIETAVGTVSAPGKSGDGQIRLLPQLAERRIAEATDEEAGHGRAAREVDLHANFCA